MEEEDHLQSFLVLSVSPASSLPGRSAAGEDIAAGSTKPEAEDVDGTSGSVSAAAAGQEELSLSDMDMVDSRIVDKGLKLKRADANPFQSFTYSLFPTMEKSLPVDWLYLTTKDMKSDNIRLHQLNTGDPVAELLDKFRKNHAKAVVFINTEDNYQLVQEFVVGVPQLTFPVLVVKQTDGKKILQCYSELYSRDDIYARVEDDMNQSRRTSNKHSDTVLHKIVESGRAGFQKFKDKLTYHPKEVEDLKTEIDRWMFAPNKNPLVLSQNTAKYQLIMSAFHNYEKLVPKKSRDIFNDIIEKLNSHMRVVFQNDFPFYLLLMFRFHKKYPKCKQFITSCIDKLEQLEIEPLAEVLNSFIQQGNFKVMYNPNGDEDQHSDAFHLLEQACLELAGVSYKDFVYSRMLWVSMAMKFHDAWKAHITPMIKSPWTEKLVNYKHGIVFENDAISSLKRGLELGRLLKLPFDLSCHYQHLGDLLASKTLRPFSHLANCVKMLDKFLPDLDHLIVMLTTIRAVYHQFLTPNKLKSVSIKGTFVGCLNEGINFLSVLFEIFTNHKISHEIMNDTIGKWLKLLIQLVDITGPEAAVHFTLFIKSDQKVMKEYKHLTLKYVIDVTKENFPSLRIHQFYHLYTSFLFWPIQFLEDFLNDYTIPSDVKLSDKIWVDYFIVVCRSSSARLHFYVSDFLIKVGQKYKESKRPVSFITDLFNLKVSKLLSVENDDDKESLEVRDRFSTFLHDYINRNALKHGLLTKMKDILNSISGGCDEFQQLVLNVLRYEVVPELKVQQVDANFRTLLRNTVSTLKDDLSWLTSLSPRQRFCWGIITTCCSKITPSFNNFEWAQNYISVISELSPIFSYYSSEKVLDNQQIIANQFPHEISSHSSDDLRKYFEWVAKILQVLDHWKKKFHHQNVSYDEVLLYANNHSKLNKLGNMVCASSLIVEAGMVQKIKTTILSNFEMLNIYLLKYIPGQPNAKWCTLPTLLEDYGVYLPQNVTKLILNKVWFPGKPGQIPEDQLGTPLVSSTSSQFQPGHDVSLKLHRNTSLCDLACLVKEISDFQYPLMDHLKMLVFFKLHQSVLCDKYLRLYLKKFTESQQQPHMQISGFILSLKLPSATFSSSPHDPTRPTEVSSLVQALKNTHELIKKIMSGVAIYSEIIAEDELMLQKLDIEREFSVLSGYILLSELSMSQCEGLDGVRSMLELFQYTSHIQNIRSVCEQYKLTMCLQDPLLNELTELIQDHITKEDRSKMTPILAKKKLKRVKEILCLDENTSSKCLDIFAVMPDSAAFYQFIRDKKFYGQQGQAIFLQQYELITAQLQHEEYDESVLNHLLAAVKVISPFVDPQNSFTDLMKEVTSLNAVNGLKQLETVNANITLIRLWFSRAEGDTLQNVEKELECLINTGHYTFQFSGNGTGSSRGRILLKYKPFSAQLPPLSTNQEEGTEGQCPIDSLQGQSSELGGRPQEELWNEEQIGDFVRKLGFMDKENEGGKQIKQFIHLNQTANKLFELYQKLRELGHPKYLSSGTIPPIPCSISQDEMDKQVHTTQDLVTQWIHKVSELRSQYSWLLYLSVPKLLQLFHSINSTSLNIGEKTDRILHEVTFLAHNTASQREWLREGIKRVLENNFKNADTSKSPMLIVGQFLDVLFKNHNLPQRCSFRDKKGLPRHWSIATTAYFAQPLYYCPAYSQADFLVFIFDIFSGIPEAYQILRCQATTTEEELSLFLKRAIQYPSHYLMLDVNKLPYKLQEHMVQLHLAMQRDHHQSQPELSLQAPSSTIHFVETAPSVLREMPWIQLMDSKGSGSSLEDVKQMCAKNIIQPSHFTCFQLVYGAAGDGKTHYIKKQLANCSVHKMITINEAFSPVSTITKLRSLPLDQSNVGLFFNFTVLPPEHSVADSERLHYQELMEMIGWFFFDLFVLGYVEDQESGLSFCFPGDLAWAIYVEVPSRDKDITAEESLKLFYDEVPTLSLLGSPHYIRQEIPFTVDSDVQLVCKYLHAYKKGVIDKIYKEGLSLIKYSQSKDLSDRDCHKLLNEYMPKHILSSKITQKLFIKYMKRRCDFLDSLPAFNYNTGSGEYFTNEAGVKVATDTKHLGSTLMHTMLREVSDFCDPSIKENWSVKAHQQLIYDFKDGGASLDLISLQPDQIEEAEITKFRKIGVKIPSMLDLNSRELLDSYLSRALNVELDNGHLTVIDNSAYVLTLDYTIKMLNIHERHECGIPVIIEGETGVGKTALVEMLSKLWNQSLLLVWKKRKENILDFLQKELGDMDVSSENYQMCVHAVESLSSGDINENALLVLCSHVKFHDQLKKLLRPMRNDPMVPLLTFKATNTNFLDELFNDVEISDSSEGIAHLLQSIFTAQVTPTFHKINIHAAMTPSIIKSLFQPVFAQARLLHTTYQEKLGQVDELKKSQSFESDDSTFSPPSPPSPFVTVFLDEVNTSSCPGLFKEIIVDKSFDGEPIPNNIFIVAACNPHRGNSLASHETWVRDTYYVRCLHPTLKFLMWDYGALDKQQERDYIEAKMKMINKDMEKSEVEILTDLVVASQDKMRDFAFRQLSGSLKQKNVESKKLSSRSCVSQRDIQRVFTFYQWFMTMYNKHHPHKERSDYHRRAVLMALGIVYYMRLNAKYRKEYKKYLDDINRMPNEVSFSTAFDEELEYYIKQVELPKGIAHTIALKENLFATIICTITHTPLIIVGAPGSSKTLSFNQTVVNLKGQESKKQLFRNTEIFRSLDPHYYQCSRRTTSNEIQTVFSRAVNRQRSHQHFNLPIYCVVFMDEAGLPEESHESLKVLHYHLDKQEVSFVAITNHVLDAAKTNRAISLFRPEALDEDLETLAKGCLCSNPESPPLKLQQDLVTVVKFCQPYSDCMKKSSEFSHFFGLRDFIQFINYLRRKRDERQDLSPLLVMQALERNFNGSAEFENICKMFLQVMDTNPRDVPKRKILEILKESIQDRPQAMQNLTENEVRYKLIIDPSEDDSLVRLLFSMGVLTRDNTRMFVCSDFPGDGELQKINTIAAIRHSAMEGHTVIMSQTDSIHESFYDLFNQRFRRIDDPVNGAHYYTNIAIGAHLKPSRVHPDFQCVVVIKESEVKDTPSPFLNRFEKYFISHGSLLETALQNLPPCMAIMIKAIKEKVNDFICQVLGFQSLYGLQPETLDSLILDLLPPLNHTYQELGEDSVVDTEQEVSIDLYLLKKILNALTNNAGFSIPQYLLNELHNDAVHVFSLMHYDPKYEGLLKTLTRQNAMRAVMEAFNLLYSAPAPQDEGGQNDLTLEGCMVVSILQLLLVRLFTKRLMQLMTTEAIILNRKKIPFSYLANYISNQAHFSLKDLITQYHKAVVALSNPSRTPNKLICFTRSSPLVHTLPAQLPSSMMETPQDLDTVADLVFQNTDKVVIHKLSGLLFQSSVQRLLRDFVVSETAEVCLLLANMQETSLKTINHIRLMMEEAELLKAQKQSTKVFVLLLHFPPVQFFQHCYPSLFLKGWDHCYLDTIAHKTLEGVVNIEDWFHKCCFPSEEDNPDKPDGLFKALMQLLPQAIPIISARVYFGNKKDASFNSFMNATERSEALKRLLFDCKIGNVLCEKFCAYWKPRVMAEYLERAATFSKQRESTLNITDSIQTQFKALYFDFCVYMLTRANENFNLDIIFAEDCSLSLRKLFIDIFRVFPTPKLNQLNILSNNLPLLKPSLHCPHFPFFGYVCSLMEKQVEVSREAANLRVDILAENDSLSIDHTPKNPAEKQQALINVLIKNLEPVVNASPKRVLGLIIDAMAKDQDLWYCYFNDFIICKLKLGGEDHVPEGDIAQLSMHTFFQQIHSYDALEKVVQLHSHVSVHWLHLAQVAPILRRLNKLQGLGLQKEPHLLSPLTPTPTSPTKQLLLSVEQTQQPLGSFLHISNFIISTLFDVLLGATYNTTTPQLVIWFKAYRDIMTVTVLKHYIYLSLSMPEAAGTVGLDFNLLEAKLNVMQATFLVLESSPSLNQDVLDEGLLTFQTLFNRYFKEGVQLKDSRPSLTGVTDVAVSLVNDSLHSCNSAVRLVMEGLLAHFFPPDRPQYHTEDILWFLKLANKQNWSANPFEVEEDKSAPIPSNKLLSGTIEMSMFKFYLARILGNYEEPSKGRANQQEFGPLLYRQENRALVGKVLMFKKELGLPGLYVPVFYQNSPPIVMGVNAKNGRMQQSLCHLYFLTLMEHLRSESKFKNPAGLSLLLRTASIIQKQLKNAEGAEAVLVGVEFQAVTQVIIQQLALYLDPTQPHSLKKIKNNIDEINLLLNDPSMGHTMVLSLHLLKLLKSSRRFIDLMTTVKYDSISCIKCLQPIHSQLKSPSEMKPHLLPFLQPGAEGELSMLYKQVSSVMLGIHNGSKKVDDLLKVARNCKPRARREDQYLSFRMMVWLATYYKFYDKQVVSPLLCNVMGGPKMSNYLQEEGYVRLIQCFLKPDFMHQHKESPNPLTERQVLELEPDGRVQVIPQEGAQWDPLYKLFMPTQADDIDQSDVDLRHSMANMLAVVLGSPPRSNHLWYHLFAANKLQKTYMTGFMYDSTIHHDRLLYDCGVELSPEGQFGRQDYKKHACRGTYTLHSLYLLLWANFSAFCLALLTQPDADQYIHGPIISKWLSVRHYCVSQLRTLWIHMRNNLGLSEEQRSFFAMRAMNRLYELLRKSSSLTPIHLNVPVIKKGVFETREDLDSYEKMWHMAIYQPTWDELAEKFVELSNQNQNKLFNEIRHLEMHYPHFPSEQEFCHTILSAGDLEQHSEGGKLRILTRFTMDWPLLKVGGDLLPDLVELYRWLHMNIAHLITYERASSLAIGHVIQLVERNSSKEMGEYLRKLYERVKDNYNRYVELVGGAIGAGACAAVRRGNKIFTIDDEIPLIHFLSDVEEEDQGNDWLYVVINNIITNHNSIIENLYSIVQPNKHTSLARLLPEEPSTIHPTEVIASHSIVSHFTELHGVSSFLQLVRSRYQPTIPGESPAVQNSIHPRQEVFQLEQLEEDIVTSFIMGKPLIKSPLLLRTVFKFKKEEQQDTSDDSIMICTALDLQGMTNSLHENFKVPLSEALLKRFEYEFHFASYHLMLEVVTALRTVLNYAIKSLQETRPGDTNNLVNQKVPEFMLSLYEHLTNDSDVLSKIGVQSASPSHISCLAELPLPSVYSCLKLFLGWVEEGYYDFCTLPFAFKVHMSYQDKSVVDQQLRLRWQGSVPDLLEELQNLIDVLKHSEQDITSRVKEAANKPIVEYLIEYHMLEEKRDHLACYIPRTIMLHHYVAFRLSLRRLCLRVQQELKGSNKSDGSLNIWSEFVSDLWEKHLPHLRWPGEHHGESNPNTGCYGFQEEEEEEGEENEDCVLTSSLLGDSADEDGGYERGGMESGSNGIRDTPMEEESFTILSEVDGHTLDLNKNSSEEKEGKIGGASNTETTHLPGHYASLEELAQKVSAQDVADFLTRIQLPQYADDFLSSDISGEVLLEADADVLNELGMTSPLHQMRVIELFRRELQGKTPRYSQEHVSRFLQQYKLEKYTPMLECHGIDGDMILAVEGKLMKSILSEVGVTSAVDNLKIRTKFKTFVSNENP